MEKKTPLYDDHVKAGGRIVPFAGYLMPVQYVGIIEEHQAVREAMGMFDLSHMGEFEISGDLAMEAVDRLMTNDILGLQPGQIRYTPMCYPNGGIVDDLLVYRFPDHLMLVVNAANIEKDLGWIRQHVPSGVTVKNISDQTALIAVQGPKAEALLRGCTNIDLAAIAYYHFASGVFAGVDAIVSRTGYTGEDGFELYVAADDAPGVWQSVLEEGAPEGLMPVGLGARDTLRLESGYMLYGNDIDETTSPLEAGLGWTVKFDQRDFIGREALTRQKSDGLVRRMVALEMDDRAIPRPHFVIRREGEDIGMTTSGTYSPTFRRGIGLGYVRTDAARAGTAVNVDIRSQPHPARVSRKPLYKREGG